MNSQLRYYVLGVLTVLIPLMMFAGIRYLAPLQIHPDKKIVYREIAGRELSLHVFASSAGQSQSPAILFFHGGAWTFGGAHAFYPQCDFFSRQGFTCISAQYSLRASPGVDVQAAVLDARFAFDYLRDNASALRINPDQIIAGGGSSGGHLAATLGTAIPLADDAATATSLVRPAALLLYNPMLDLSPCTPDHHLVKSFWNAVSPYQHIDAESPPTLIMVGSEDPEVPVATARAYCEAMAREGGDCEVAVWEGARHGFFNQSENGGKYFLETNQKALEFLRGVLVGR